MVSFECNEIFLHALNILMASIALIMTFGAAREMATVIGVYPQDGSQVSLLVLEFIVGVCGRLKANDC